MQVIELFFIAAGFADELGEGVTNGSADWVNLTRTVGEENVKPLAVRYNHPFFSPRTVVATCAVPSEATMDTVAETGAAENPYIQRATSDFISKL